MVYSLAWRIKKHIFTSYIICILLNKLVLAIKQAYSWVNLTHILLKKKKKSKRYSSYVSLVFNVDISLKQLYEMLIQTCVCSRVWNGPILLTLCCKALPTHSFTKEFRNYVFRQQWRSAMNSEDYFFCIVGHCKKKWCAFVNNCKNNSVEMLERNEFNYFDAIKIFVEKLFFN